MTGGLPGTGMNPADPNARGPVNMWGGPGKAPIQVGQGTNPADPMGPGGQGSFGPMPPSGGLGGPLPLQNPGNQFGTGQSFQSPPPAPMQPNPQPPNAVSNQVPGVRPLPGPMPAQPVDPNARPPITGMKPGPPIPVGPVPMSRPPRGAGPMPAQPTSPVPVGLQNKMTVHNPTGIGADAASNMAAVRRPIPANQPTKKVGPVQPKPSNIPGGI